MNCAYFTEKFTLRPVMTPRGVFRDGRFTKEARAHPKHVNELIALQTPKHSFLPGSNESDRGYILCGGRMKGGRVHVGRGGKVRSKEEGGVREEEE